jgi:hypothetical protein
VGEVRRVRRDEHYQAIDVKGYVGLVDEHEGGMIAYGTPEMMDRLADLLNRLDAIERIARPITRQLES